MIGAMRRVAAEGGRKAVLAIGRAIVRLVDDSGELQRVQVDMLADETIDDAERYQDYGFASRPKPGAEGVYLALGGVRGNGVVIAVADRRYRLTGLQEGEAALHDDQGQAVHLKRDGIRIETPFKVEVEAAGDVLVTAGGAATVTSAGALTVDAPRINLGAGADKKVARMGDPVVSGAITNGSAVVYAK
jgi:phage baseplate assembly protein V